MSFEMNGPSRRLMSEINVTPFVDVMLVLLVIFMVTAPMMMQGIDVKVPEVDARAIGREQDRVIISVTAQGDIFLDEYKVSLENLGLKVKQIMKVRRTEEVFLRADQAVAYGEIARVISEIRQAGVANLGLVTEPERVKAPGRK